MEDTCIIVIDFCENKFMYQRKGHAMERETAPISSIYTEMFLPEGWAAPELFFCSRDKGIGPVCSVVSWAEESGPAPETVVLGLKCKHHRWSMREHEMWVRCVCCMREVGDMAGLTEKAAQGDLVLGRRLWLCPSSRRWIIKYLEGSSSEKQRG